MRIVYFIVLLFVLVNTIVASRVHKRRLRFVRRSSLLPDIVLPSISTQPTVPKGYYPVNAATYAQYTAYTPPQAAAAAVPPQAAAAAVISPQAAAVYTPPQAAAPLPILQVPNNDDDDEDEDEPDEEDYDADDYVTR